MSALACSNSSTMFLTARRTAIIIGVNPAWVLASMWVDLGGGGGGGGGGVIPPLNEELGLNKSKEKDPVLKRGLENRQECVWLLKSGFKKFVLRVSEKGAEHVT